MGTKESEVCTLSDKEFYLFWCLGNIGSWRSVRDGVLKMTRGSMVVLKGVRCNNIYYLMDSMVIGQVATSVSSDSDCTQVWHMRLEHTGEKSLQAITKKGSLEGTFTCNIELGGHGVLDKKMKVKFNTSTYRS